MHRTPAPHEGAPPDPSVAVRTLGLTKRYGTRTAVDALDLDVPAGVVSGFVGPNGAGKTTTIRMLLGLVAPTAGRGWVLGSDLRAPASYLRQVGAMIEGPAFTPGLSGAANLRVLAHTGDLPPARVGEVLERVGLADRADDAFRSYSLGMKQRLGLAAALLPRPRLLVLDEPTNGLDPAGIAQMRALLASFREDGVTVLVSSHLLAELEQVADHLVVIDHGRLTYAGPVSGVLDAYPPRVRLSVLRPDDLATVRAAVEPVAPPGARVRDEGELTLAVPLPPDTSDEQARATAAELNRLALGAGVALAGLAVTRPSLEEAFLAMTGPRGENPVTDRPAEVPTREQRARLRRAA